MDPVIVNSPEIEHLVLSGCGPNMVIEIAYLQHFQQSGKLDVSKLKSVYGVSAGACLSTLLLMKIPIEDILNYLLDRPWHKVMDVTVDMLLECNGKCGLWSSDIIGEVLLPFFHTVDISPDITMKEFYEYIPVDLHIIVTELESFEMVDFNHETFPDLKLIDALKMTCIIPIMFIPFIYNGKRYVDGGVVANYPIKHCIDHLPKTEHDKILGIHIYKNPKCVCPSTSIQMLYYILTQFAETVSNNHHQTQLCKYDIIAIPEYSMYEIELWKLWVGPREDRMKIYELGVQSIDDALRRIETGTQELI